jgi:hypothetical protein
MTVKLVGHDDEAGTVNHPGDCIKCAKYTAVATGTCSEIRIKCSGSGNVKVAIYADSGGEPGARLGVCNTSTAVVAGWNTIPLDASFSIVSGTDYWLAFNSDATIVREKAETRQGRYKSVAFTNDLPDPAGSGYTADTVNSMIAAGWGLITISDISQLIWNTRKAISGTSQEVWNVRKAISDVTQLVYNVRKAISGTSQYIWNTRKAINDTIQSIWNVRKAIFDTCQAIWNVLAIPLVKLIGRDDVARDAGGCNPNELHVVKFVAESSGNVMEIRFRAYPYIAANVMVGMYADNAGAPGALLGQKEVVVSSGADRIISVPLDTAIPVSSGTAYWFGHNQSATQLSLRNEAGVRKARTYSYGTLPNPAGTGFWALSYNTIISGWGMAGEVASKTFQLVWKVRKAISDTNQLQWNIRKAISDTLQAVWNVLSPVSAIADIIKLVWNTRNAVADTMRLLWKVEAKIMVVALYVRSVMVQLYSRLMGTKFDHRHTTTKIRRRRG